jgi:hypothetical protein
MKERGRTWARACTFRAGAGMAGGRVGHEGRKMRCGDGQGDREVCGGRRRQTLEKRVLRMAMARATRIRSGSMSMMDCSCQMRRTGQSLRGGAWRGGLLPCRTLHSAP